MGYVILQLRNARLSNLKEWIIKLISRVTIKEPAAKKTRIKELQFTRRLPIEIRYSTVFRTNQVGGLIFRICLSGPEGFVLGEKVDWGKEEFLTVRSK